MEITESLSQKPKETLLCQVRKIQVRALPEERVRQHLIHHMVKRLGYPSELLSVEVPIQKFPHLKEQQDLPDRRVDLVCFAKSIDSIHPLLVVECKAHPLGKEALRQVEGYNVHLKSKFIAVANQSEIQTKSREGDLVKGLPSYKQLLDLS